MSGAAYARFVCCLLGVPDSVEIVEPQSLGRFRGQQHTASVVCCVGCLQQA